MPVNAFGDEVESGPQAVNAFGDPVEAPAPKIGPGSDFSGARAGAGNDLRAGARGLLDMVPFSHRIIGALEGKPVQDVDAAYEAEKEANPIAFHSGQAVGALALPGPGGIKGMALLGGLQAAGDARGGAVDTLGQGAFGTALGALLGGGGKLVGAAANKALPFLKRLEAKYALKVLDASVKPAEATLRSATGTLGAVSREGSSTLRDLAEGIRPGSPLPVAEQGLNRAALDLPEAQALASDLAGKARDRLPGQLNSIENGRGLVQQATQDVATARTPAALAQTEQNMRGYANDTLLKRYLLPAASGAVAGEVMGGDDHNAMGLAGMSLGLGARPMLRAIVRQASNPGYAAPLTRAAVSTAQRLAGLATTQPALLGKFAAPLAHAAGRGEDAVAAAHYVLSADPQYQDLIHQAEGEQ